MTEVDAQTLLDEFNNSGMNGMALYMTVTSGYLIIFVSWFCCAYGLALFAFRFRERPRTTAATALSPNFVQAGATVVMPVAQDAENAPTTEQSNAE